MTHLLPVTQARQRLADAFTPLPTEFVPLAHATGRILAQDLRAPFNLPPFDNSSMDGFAVRSTDLQTASRANPVTLQIIADIPAGALPHITLQPGTAARIMTGSALPLGADAVLPVEQTNLAPRFTPDSPLPEKILAYGNPTSGAYLRRAGEDAALGETILHAPIRLTPQHIGLLAMLGKTEVPVHMQPRVYLLATGDELLEPGEPLQPGKIYNSNSPMLASLLQQYGAQPIALGSLPDQRAAIRTALQQAVDQRAHLILSSAGVSVGAFDYISEILQTEGNLNFWRVNMRPGKPLAFGAYHGIPFIGLPGNPVSAFVGFHVFVRAALARLSGLTEDTPTQIYATLQHPLESDGRESYLRAQLTPVQDGYHVKLVGHQGSGNLRALANANALLIVPAGVTSLAAGETVRAWLL
ncbi:MAG: molybdopterin molybdotransferase MoeA [Anaerolineales bacterium]